MKKRQIYVYDFQIALIIRAERRATDELYTMFLLDGKNGI